MPINFVFKKYVPPPEWQIVQSYQDWQPIGGLGAWNWDGEYWIANQENADLEGNGYPGDR